MKKLFSLILFILLILTPPAALASKKHTPHRYTYKERNLKHAGAVRKNSAKNQIMNLNYNTNTGFNYNNKSFNRYNNITSGLNYKTGAGFRYR